MLVKSDEYPGCYNIFQKDLVDVILLDYEELLKLEKEIHKVKKERKKDN